MAFPVAGGKVQSRTRHTGIETDKRDSETNAALHLSYTQDRAIHPATLMVSRCLLSAVSSRVCRYALDLHTVLSTFPPECQQCRGVWEIAWDQSMVRREGVAEGQRRSVRSNRERTGASSSPTGAV